MEVYSFDRVCHLSPLRSVLLMKLLGIATVFSVFFFDTAELSLSGGELFLDAGELSSSSGELT